MSAFPPTPHRPVLLNDVAVDLRLDALLEWCLLLRSLPLTDPVTGLYNRRGFLRAGARELANAAIDQRVVCLHHIVMRFNPETWTDPKAAARFAQLRAAARALRRTFGNRCVIGRTHFAEFVALDPADREERHLHRRLRLAIDAETTDPVARPTRLTTARFDPQRPLPIVALLAQAAWAGGPVTPRPPQLQ